MSRADDRRAAQAELERDWETDLQRRPNVSPTPVPLADRCFTGRAHRITMRGPDGQLRCWTCARTRASIAEGR